jgi:hypothetical protein
MKYLARSTAVLVAMCTLTVAAGPAVAGTRPNPRLQLRADVNQTSTDLFVARQTAAGPPDVKRLVSARHKLTIFADRVFQVASQYHPGELRGVIKGVENVLAHNMLLADTRARLSADVGHLQNYYNAHH